jgi:hypothetical protein
MDTLEVLREICKSMTERDRKKLEKSMNKTELRNFWLLLNEMGYHKSDNHKLTPGPNNEF